MIDKSKLEQSTGYLQGKIETCGSEEIKTVPLDYKKKLSGSFYSINGDEITKKINGNDFYVSKKLDGQLQLIYFEKDEIFIIGRNGTVRNGLPCAEKLKIELKNQNISQLLAAAELYYKKDGERTRVYDVISALADEKKLDYLSLAVFDIMKVNHEDLKVNTYLDVLNKINEVIPATEEFHPIHTQTAKSKDEIANLYQKWVQEGGLEGLIVRSDMPFIFKVKPKHTFDAVILGYAEGINDRKGMVKSLLFGFLLDENKYQIVGKVGNNLSDEDRINLLAKLKEMHVNSTYVTTDNDGIAFRMIKPELVVEVGCNDILIETSVGNPLENHLIEYKGSYQFKQTLQGIKFLFPVFERLRDDKSNTLDDVNFNQMKDFVYLPEKKIDFSDLPKSEMLMREVYKKEAKDKLMVQKFLVWKTNKEQEDQRFPAYVLYYTNFSSGRKDPLKRDIRISNDKKQIMALAKEFVESNVKKGWEQV